MLSKLRSQIVSGRKYQRGDRARFKAKHPRLYRRLLELEREYSKGHKDKDKTSAYWKRWWAKNRDYRRKYFARKPIEKKKYLARGEVARAVKKSGRLVKLPCQVPECKETETVGHHKDYDKPLEVVWLCTPHHKATHHDPKFKPVVDKLEPVPPKPRTCKLCEKEVPGLERFCASHKLEKLREHNRRTYLRRKNNGYLREYYQKYYERKRQNA